MTEYAMVRTALWYGDADDPAEWYEAILYIGNSDVEAECTACGNKTRNFLDVEDQLAVLCLSCLDATIKDESTRLVERKSPKAPVELPFPEKLKEQAQELGRRHGKAAGSWLFNGNTEQDEYAKVMRGYEDGDPEVMDRYRSPLSGEFADDLTPAKLMDELGILLGTDDEPEQYDDIIDAYEQAHSESFWDEVIDVCKYHLAEAAK